MKVKRIANFTLNSNSYILSEEGLDIFWLVDVGDINQIIRNLPNDAKVSGVFLTHTHYDHIYGINWLIDRFPDCTVYTSDFGRSALYSAKLNFSKYYDNPIIFSGTNVQIVCEGNFIELFPDCGLSVFETPGHDPSCLTYRVGNHIFPGDSYMPGFKVITSFPRSDRSLTAISLERIIGMIDEDTIVCPGHHAVYLNGEEFHL